MQSRIRNFSIIAHVDHGKSTLSDRFIQACQGLTERQMADQVLDTMDLERERGITIKAQAVTLDYHARDGQTYQLNFIDTPGHVDFSYEVSRSLAACEGALLVVDASQGVEAQSVGNTYTAIAQDLEVLPTLNKVDLPAADPDSVADQIEEIIGLDAADRLLVSGKSGLGITDLLEAIVAQVPPPTGDADASLQALIVDSWFDNYLGVVSLVKIVNGRLAVGERIHVMATGRDHVITEVGRYTPRRSACNSLENGQVGYVIAGIKEIDGAPVGDTLTHTHSQCEQRVPGFREVQPRVFAGVYTVDANEYEDFRDALAKLRLNDSSLSYEPETSDALGFGFRIGFLGMLHLEIVQERLEREYGLNLITTAPTVVFELENTTGELISISNPTSLPPPEQIESIREPIIKASILTPNDYTGPVMQLCMEKRGVQKDMSYVGNSVSMVFELPLAEVVLDFFDRLQSVSRGFASFEYEHARFQAAELVRLDVRINGDNVDALAHIVHKDQAFDRGKALVEKLKNIVPRQMFDVAIQATVGNRIIARSTVKAMRKNVTAKCYGGDVSRKRKLLDKQKKGKRRMKQLGEVDIPQEAFLAVLSTGEDDA